MSWGQVYPDIYRSLLEGTKRGKSILRRKLEFIARFASYAAQEGITVSWEYILTLIYLNTVSSIAYRFFLDMYLNLNYNIDPKDFDFHQLDFAKYFEPECEPHWYKPVLGSVTPEELEKICWSFHYNLVTKEKIYWRYSGRAIFELWDWFRDYLLNRGVDPQLVQMIFELMMILEGKMKALTFVGFAIVDFSTVAPVKVEIRNPWAPWKTMTIYPEWLYENFVGLSRVGFCRVTGTGHSPALWPKKELSEHFAGEVEGFRKRVGLVPLSPEVMLHQRIFNLQRLQRWEERGTYHQLKQQINFRAVREVLDREGVPGSFRPPYYMFVNEVVYRKYKGHRKWKHWKENLTIDEIIQKYIKQGCEERILRKILQTIGITS